MFPVLAHDASCVVFAHLLQWETFEPLQSPTPKASTFTLSFITAASCDSSLIPFPLYSFATLFPPPRSISPTFLFNEQPIMLAVLISFFSILPLTLSSHTPILSL